MTYLITIFNILFMINALVIFDFQKDSNLSQWRTVNDDVMGGVSNSRIYLNDEGNATFEGKVSLENNGGFAMTMYSFDEKNVSNYSKAIIKLRGDGKKYQYRVKSKSSEYFSYITNFETTGDWQTIELNLEDMYPSYRGRKLDKSNYPVIKVEQIAFLIGNKKEQQFKLELDAITFM